MLRKSLCSYLPIPVQTVTKSISITGKRNKDGTKYLVVILMGYGTGRKPNLSHIRIFGWTAYAQIPQDERSKFVSKAIKCILVGYCEIQKVFRLWDLVNRRIRISWDVKFHKVISPPSSLLAQHIFPPQRLIFQKRSSLLMQNLSVWG